MFPREALPPPAFPAEAAAILYLSTQFSLDSGNRIVETFLNRFGAGKDVGTFTFISASGCRRALVGQGQTMGNVHHVDKRGRIGVLAESLGPDIGGLQAGIPLCASMV